MKTIVQIESPKTQSIDAVKALLAFKKVACNPLPQEISLDDGRLVLVLNNKKDAYYVVTPTGCSCPAATYHPGQPCKHSMKYFPQQKREAPREQGDLRVTLPGWPGGHNGPVMRSRGRHRWPQSLHLRPEGS